MLINKQFKVPVGHNKYEGPSQTHLYLHDSHTGRVHMVGIPEKKKVVIIIMFNVCTKFGYFLSPLLIKSTH
jgi:hypothetical protein